jgi:hypothetical protein
MSDDQIRTELQAIRGDIASLRGEVMNILRNGCVHGPEHAETLKRVGTMEREVSELRGKTMVWGSMLGAIGGAVMAWIGKKFN